MNIPNTIRFTPNTVLVVVDLIEPDGTCDIMISTFDKDTFHEKSADFMQQVVKKCASKTARIENWYTFRTRGEYDAWKQYMSARSKAT